MPRRCVVRAKILEDLGDHETAAASRNEASALLRGCADADIAQTVLTAAQRSKCVAVSPRNQADTVAEKLTAKEHEVLRLLATRLSRREIGQRLYVSLNTVKTHQRALYRKLGVENRAAAVTRARELGLRLTRPATPRPIQSHPRSSRGEQSRSNHPGEQAVRVMTIHPARRKSHGEQPSASSDHTGTTKARPPHGAATGSRTKR